MFGLARSAICQGMLLMSVVSISGFTMAADDIVDNVVLGIHGGTGYDKKDCSPEMAAEFRKVLSEALTAGKARLDAGGTSLDAVEAAIRLMEDAPCLNAGRGAVFTHEGRNELDASVMEGTTLKAGSVAGVTILKNPISAARAVMERSKHVMMIGRGAEVFASGQGLEVVDPHYFWTEHRWKDIQKVWAKEKNPQGALGQPRKPDYGTVGAVARDAKGHLAAGTSTGGMTNKMFGRVGDSPIIGAGTYADDRVGAVSCTGHGEYFIRYAVAHEIISQTRYAKVNIEVAAHDVINRQLKEANGEGAAIALDRHGRFTTAFNSEGLYRACITADGKVRVRLYED